MKKLLLAIFVILGTTGAYIFLQKQMVPVSSKIVPTTNTSQNTPVPSSASGVYKDGSYTGDTVQTDRGYGPMQVKIVVVGGKIIDVQFLQFPNLPGHTIEVSNESLPILKQEAIASQNAQVDIVTGATQTSQAFQQSLQSALALAR